MLFGCKLSLEIVSNNVRVRWSDRFPSGESAFLDTGTVDMLVAISMVLVVVAAGIVAIVIWLSRVEAEPPQPESAATMATHEISRNMTLQKGTSRRVTFADYGNSGMTMVDGSPAVSPAVSLRAVTKRFGPVTAVDQVNLQINEGEFFSVLGPSGSGKTTVLRLIAGFDQPDEGSVLLGGEEVAGRAPFDRDVNTVFQDYALFPHMSVQKNVEYGLMVKGVGRLERTQRARAMLETVRLGGLESRRPSQLSGGQRQRVALARALVNQPKVLLLDEPLGALDLKLREEMQVELKSIQQVVGITFIYVTHDQGEALSMSDRIAVFNQGRIEQVGTARDLYERPASAFVASFVGTTNLFADDLAERLVGKRGVFTLRPEHVQVNRVGSGNVSGKQVDATVIAVQYLGADSRVYCALSDGSKVISRMASDAPTAVVPGESVVLSWSPESVFTVTS